jgi:hypothetical protein
MTAASFACSSMGVERSASLIRRNDLAPRAPPAKRVALPSVFEVRDHSPAPAGERLRRHLRRLVLRAVVDDEDLASTLAASRYSATFVNEAPSRRSSL